MEAADSEVDDVFLPLRHASRGRLTAAIIIGPLAWLVAVVVASAVLANAKVIQIGLIVGFGAVAVALVVLTLVRRARIEEEQEYAEGR